MVSSVLDSTPPRFSAEDAARIAAELFGLRGSVSDLGSERDQAFLLDDGRAGAVIKISNSGEDAAMLDLEEAAIAHVAAVEPDLPVARPLAPRATFDGHHVRLFELGRGHKGGPELGDARSPPSMRVSASPSGRSSIPRPAGSSCGTRTRRHA